MAAPSPIQNWIENWLSENDVETQSVDANESMSIDGREVATGGLDFQVNGEDGQGIVNIKTEVDE